MSSNHFIGCRISPGDWQQVQIACGETGLTQSAWLRQQIRAGLDQRNLVMTLSHVLKAFGRHQRKGIKLDLEEILQGLELSEISTSGDRHEQ